MPEVRVNAIMQDSYLSWRRQNGYSIEEIEAKTKSLSGAMRLWSQERTEGVLRSAGASKIVPIYHIMNFGGLFAVKD